jgi:protein TonB
MKTIVSDLRMTPFLFPVLLLLGACAGQNSETETASQARVEEAIAEAVRPETTPDATSMAATLDSYKLDIAERIVQVNSTKVYTTRPQALLRSVIVVKYVIDANGNLVSSNIMRSNRDRANEQTAMASLKKTAPFPKPASHLLRQNRIELSESWLFNTDGRFQLRSTALPQMDR